MKIGRYSLVRYNQSFVPGSGVSTVAPGFESGGRFSEYFRFGRDSELTDEFD